MTRVVPGCNYSDDGRRMHYRSSSQMEDVRQPDLGRWTRRLFSYSDRH